MRSWNERLAAFEGTEAALVFPSGFAANAGVVPALADEGDAIFGDAKNHASLIDGCRLSKATRFVYPHRDCAALEAMLLRWRAFSSAADRDGFAVQHGWRFGAACSNFGVGRALRCDVDGG